MKMYSTIYTTYTDFKKYVFDNEISIGKETLIQMFTGVVDEEYIKQVVGDILEVLPNATVIGTTTAGEILDDNITSGRTVLAISEFEQAYFKSAIVTKKTASRSGKIIADKILDENSKAVVVFCDALNTNPNPVINSIRNADNNLIISGGLASDNGLVQKTLVFLNNKVTDNGVVAFSLNGANLFVRNHYKFNWRPVGKKMTVTKSEGNLVHEIEGATITEIYRKYLGDEITDGLPRTGALYPLVKEYNDMTVGRVLFVINEDGSAIYSGDINEGDSVRFAYASINMIMNNDYLDKLDGDIIEAGYIYSCFSRKILLKDSVGDETKPLSEKFPVAGFFTYGEIYSSKERVELLNETLTMLLISEKSDFNLDSEVKKEKLTSAYISTDTILKAITHLTDTVSKEIEVASAELEKKNKELERLSVTDKLTGLYNRVKLDEVLKERFELYNANNVPYAVMILDIDYFKKVNDTYGHLVGDSVLVELSEILQSIVRKKDVVGRWGGEEFMVICTVNDLTEAEFIGKKIRKKIEKYNFKECGFRTVSVGVSIVNTSDEELEDIIKRADDALYEAKESGRNRVISKA